MRKLVKRLSQCKYKYINNDATIVRFKYPKKARAYRNAMIDSAKWCIWYHTL